MKADAALALQRDQALVEQARLDHVPVETHHLARRASRGIVLGVERAVALASTLDDCSGRKAAGILDGPSELSRLGAE